MCVCVCLRMCVCTCACACVYMGGIFTTDDADDVGTSMCVTVCMCLLALLTGLCLGVCVCASNPCVCVCVCACVPPGTHPVPGHRDWVTLLPPPLQSLIRYWVTLPPPWPVPRYWVTWKADGTRYMMWVDSRGCHLIDRSNNVARVQMRFPTSKVRRGGGGVRG